MVNGELTDKTTQQGGVDMTLKFATLGLSLGIAAFASATSAQAAPTISTRWKDLTMSQEDCLQRAESALSTSSFGRLERTPQSRYGTRGDYTAAIRCVAENKIVFFIVGGPSRETAPRYMNEVFDNF